MRQLAFNHSDIEGRKALLITLTNLSEGPDGIGASNSMKLFREELEEAAEIAEASEHLCDPADYSNIRECLGHLIGHTVLDITQHDAEEFQETKRSYIQLLLSNGDYLKIFVGPLGFCYSINEEEKP